MNQRDAVMKVMEENGGYATLGFLYGNVLKVPGVEWKTKSPFASMRRIVQDPKYFFKIRPGLWALKGWEKKIPFDVLAQGKVASKVTEELNHSYYQGLLVEIGNVKKFQTFVPNQDKNRKFLKRPLASVVTVPTMYPFTFPNLVDRAQTIDVTWFNPRNMPNAFFEVEHSTDIQNSLGKFVDLQDFNANFWIVAPKAREREYAAKVGRTQFESVAKRVKFMSYDSVSVWHTKAHELAAVESRL